MASGIVQKGSRSLVQQEYTYSSLEVLCDISDE